MVVNESNRVVKELSLLVCLIYSKMITQRYMIEMRYIAQGTLTCSVNSLDSYRLLLSEVLPTFNFQPAHSNLCRY